MDVQMTCNGFSIFIKISYKNHIFSGSTAGQKEIRYYDDIANGYAAYNDIYKKKTAAGKGYKPLNLVKMNSNIGSEKVKGKSAGNIDEKTLKKLEESKNPEKKVKEKPKKSLNLHPSIEKLISYLYVNFLYFPLIYLNV